MSRLVTVAAVLAVVVSGCTAGTDTGARGSSGASTATPSRTAPAEPADACTLVSERAVDRATGRDLRVVGRAVEAPTLPTESCWWGREFSVPVLELRVTPGPVAEDTFEKAFGPAAGGEPTRVDVGDAAWSRSGLTDRTLQVLSGGTVLTLEAKDDPGEPLPAQALPRIARVAIDDLPSHPELPDGAADTPCSAAEGPALAAVLGGEPRLRRFHDGRDDAMMCSWSALPGNLVLTVRTARTQVTNFRANLTPRLYTEVDQLDVEAYSQRERAGDLLMFVDGMLVEMEALPADGLPAATSPTSRAELRMARALVRTFRSGPGAG
jgi:hypothetical protein